jgi:calreticulin
MRSVAATLATFSAVVLGKVYFEETFETDPFAENRWVHSDVKQESGEASKFEYSSGLWTFDESRKGLRTPDDARFYIASSKLAEPFNNEGKDLVVQFNVKHEQKIDCGGGYLKLFPTSVDQATLSGDDAYAIMFGPDICGYSTKKVHAIFSHNGENLLKSEDVKTPDDVFTHTFRLVVHPDDTYALSVDGEEKAAGNLKDDFPFEQPKTIPDPEAEKPEDWVDQEQMDDPEDVKPEGYDDIPEKISDPDASKPEDWDDEEDGEWEAPLIRNPEFKGKWKPKRIKNPAFKGKWEAPQVPNPDHVEFSDVYKRGDIGYVGLEIWQVKAGTLFSDFILTDSVEEADAFTTRRAFDAEAEKDAKKAFDDANAPADEPDEEFEEDEDFDEDEVHTEL